MKVKFLTRILVLSLLGLILTACGGEQPIDIKTIMSSPKAYVGSDTCKMCHLEHYDSWHCLLYTSPSPRD